MESNKNVKNKDSNVTTTEQKDDDELFVQDPKELEIPPLQPMITVNDQASDSSSLPSIADSTTQDAFKDDQPESDSEVKRIFWKEQLAKQEKEQLAKQEKEKLSKQETDSKNKKDQEVKTESTNELFSNIAVVKVEPKPKPKINKAQKYDDDLPPRTLEVETKLDDIEKTKTISPPKLDPIAQSKLDAELENASNVSNFGSTSSLNEYSGNEANREPPVTINIPTAPKNDYTKSGKNLSSSGNDVVVVEDSNDESKVKDIVPQDESIIITIDHGNDTEVVALGLTRIQLIRTFAVIIGGIILLIVFVSIISLFSQKHRSVESRRSFI